MVALFCRYSCISRQCKTPAISETGKLVSRSVGVNITNSVLLLLLLLISFALFRAIRTATTSCFSLSSASDNDKPDDENLDTEERESRMPSSTAVAEVTEGGEALEYGARM